MPRIFKMRKSCRTFSKFRCVAIFLQTAMHLMCMHGCACHTCTCHACAWYSATIQNWCVRGLSRYKKQNRCEYKISFQHNYIPVAISYWTIWNYFFLSQAEQLRTSWRPSILQDGLSKTSSCQERTNLNLRNALYVWSIGCSVQLVISRLGYRCVCVLGLDLYSMN